MRRTLIGKNDVQLMFNDSRLFVSKIDIYKSSFLSVFTRSFFLGPVLEEEKFDV